MNHKEFALLKDRLRILNKKISDIEAFKGHFLSNVRNTIVNPFTSIVGISEEIIRTDKEDWKKVTRLASMIHSEAFDLDFQLNNIFCAAELESGELFPEATKTNLVQLIERVLKKNDLKLKRKSLKVHTTFDVLSNDHSGNVFQTDSRFIELIISNLLDNAIKFSREKEDIIIDLIQNEDNVTISLSDQGKGMCESDRRQIFDRFKRLDANINSIESGHGLGLSIVKVLVELLEGEISIESKIGLGTKFIIKIPVIKTEDDLMYYSSDGNEFLFVDEASF